MFVSKGMKRKMREMRLQNKEDEVYIIVRGDFNARTGKGRKNKRGKREER